VIDIPQSFWLDEDQLKFPEIELALKEPNGLIAIGGDLSLNRLLEAYSRGIFPWYGKDEPILWYSPDPRMIITPNSFHLSKSLKKTINSSRFDVLVDTSFNNIIRQCQEAPRLVSQEHGSMMRWSKLIQICTRKVMRTHTKCLRMESLWVDYMGLH